MKKNNYAIYVLTFYIILIGILLLTSCSVVSRVFPSKNSVCPSNDSKYFFRQAGTKPTKQFIRNNKH